MTTTSTPIRRALISVADKAGIVDFARFLAEHDVELLSTGGSAKALAEAGVPVKEVSEHTGFPEIMEGRVKTLHPKIHGGLLARRDRAEDVDAMTDYSISPIDLLVGNLYPFEEVMTGGGDWEACIENIDVGGVAMLRAAAKNHAFVTVVVDPGDYQAVMDDMTANDGAVSEALRRRLAADAFARTATYDCTISQWFADQIGEALPKRLAIAAERVETLRYGENPHQAAALYSSIGHRPGVISARQVQGRELSYNNIADADAALELVSEFDRPAIAIIKHANPCGVAIADGLTEAFFRARGCDPNSAFGGIIAANRPLDLATARAIGELFCEVVVVPEIAPDALEALAPKTNLRILVVDALPDPAAAGMTFRSVNGGLLAQSRDHGRLDPAALQTVTRRTPTGRELDDLKFAFSVVKHVKSNAIVYAREGATLGIGAGQMSRVDSARLAARKAQEAATEEGETGLRTEGSVVASDAFFPFADGLRAVIEAGATAVIQPGGSVRDRDVIDAADRAGIAMVFTGVRHFLH